MPGRFIAQSASEWPGGTCAGSYGRPNNPVPAGTYDYHDRKKRTFGIVQSRRTKRTRVFSSLEFLVRFVSRQNEHLDSNRGRRLLVGARSNGFTWEGTFFGANGALNRCISMGIPPSLNKETLLIISCPKSIPRENQRLRFWLCLTAFIHLNK